MASFTSLPTKLKSKIIEEIVLSITEEMAKDVNPCSLYHISIAMYACQERFLPLASVSGTITKHLIDACWLYGYKSVVKGSEHSEDQAKILQYLHHYYATVMCNAYEHDTCEKPYPQYWLYHRCYDPELEPGFKKEPAKEIILPVWESPDEVSWESTPTLWTMYGQVNAPTQTSGEEDEQ